MAARASHQSRSRPSASGGPGKLLAFPARRAPLANLIDAILENADLRHDLGGGRTLLRLSAGAVARAQRLAAIGEDVGRLSDLAVIWDEREDVLLRVLEGPAAQAEREAEPSFELTPAALDYL
ncbi:MAG: hypothetical protein ACREEH_11430, partial [Caulobacteraceae bacterium]